MTRFYFTAIHGCVTLTWTQNGPALSPFLAPFDWRDADYR
jgi:hypothetical protein